MTTIGGSALAALDQITSPFDHRSANLKGRTIYLAHPIDMADLTERQKVAMTELARRLHSAGAVVYDPASAFTIGQGAPVGPVVSVVNRAAIGAADALIACYPETPGVGVAMEIEMAERMGMPSLILTDAGARSWSLAGLEHAILTTTVTSSHLDQLAEEAAEYSACRGQVPATQPIPLWTVVEEAGNLPVRKHHDDCAFDLFVSEETRIGPGETIDVPCGAAFQFPDRVWGLVLGRSSTSRVHRLLIHPAVIDTGYRGPMFAQVENRGTEEFRAEVGMRLAQMIPLPNLATDMQILRTVALAPSDRGLGGFGSTGR